MALQDITSSWESVDTIKILLSIFAGLILGIEREFKDKSAGLKTITIICLGSTLFTIMSYKMGAGESEDATRIASYVVSGIGFLGAGVIFKDGFNVGGLTTASIIWMAAAVGMALGFGEFLLAFAFLIASVFIVSFGNFLNRWIFDKRVMKNITVHVPRHYSEITSKIIAEIKAHSRRMKEKSYQCNDDEIIISYDVFIEEGQLIQLKEFLLDQKEINYFIQ